MASISNLSPESMHHEKLASMSVSLIDANFVVVTTMACAFAFEVCISDEYCGFRRAIMRGLRHPRTVLPEFGGFLAVGLMVISGLLLNRDSSLVDNTADLDQQLNSTSGFSLQSSHMDEIRRHWPVLKHPDSLLAIHQLLRALGALLLLARGACTVSGCKLAPGLIMLSIASGLRLLQWGPSEDGDYVPEGPLGGRVSAICASIALVTQLVAAWAPVRTSGIRSVIFHNSVPLAICWWVTSWNHITASNSLFSNWIFAAIDTVDMCGVVSLVVALCATASETPRIGGALTAFAVAQVLSLWWFLDFGGLFDDPAYGDDYIRLVIQVKIEVQRMVYGNPFWVMSVSQFVGVSGICAACLTYAVMHPDVTPQEVIDSLEIVQFSPEVDEPGASCAICLADFNKGDLLRRLPCGHHHFHPSCVDQWLTSSRKCPMCRADIEHDSCKLKCHKSL